MVFEGNHLPVGSGNNGSMESRLIGIVGFSVEKEIRRLVGNVEFNRIGSGLMMLIHGPRNNETAGNIDRDLSITIFRNGIRDGGGSIG